MTARALLLLASAYAGKYEGDPRLEIALRAIPAALERARERVAVPGEVRVEVADLGRGNGGPVARMRPASNDGFVIVLYAEPLVLRAHDLQRTLAHELVHCRQLKGWGARGHLAAPAWVKEGTAVWLAGQWPERARALAAHAGRDALPADALGRLVNGLDGPHTLLDYAEDAAAFAGVAARHGDAKARALVDALLRGTPPKTAVRDALGEEWERFDGLSRAHARDALGPLVEEGRAALLRQRALVAAGENRAALDLPSPGGVYEADHVFLRAQALLGAGRAADGLRELRAGLLDRDDRRATTLLDRAIVLELRLLRALGRDEELARRLAEAERDLEPYDAYPELAALR